MNSRALLVATLIGTALQVAMISAGHYVPYVRDKVFMLGGLFLSLVAGAIYARMAPGPWSFTLLGGCIAGGVCALIGIAASVALDDTPAAILLVGTATSVVAGLIGAAFAKLVLKPPLPA